MAACDGCRFLKLELGDKTVPDRLVCRRYPPQIAMDDEGELMRVFPAVNPDDWCGEYERRGSQRHP